MFRFSDSDPCCTLIGVCAALIALVTFGGMCVLLAVSPETDAHGHLRDYTRTLQFWGALAIWLAALAVLWLALMNGVHVRCPGRVGATQHGEPARAAPSKMFVLIADEDLLNE